MSMVTSETIYRSTEICLLMLIARGWTFIRKGLTQNDLSSLIVMMGLVYLSYCAMFITYDIKEAQSTSLIWMNILHFFIMHDISNHCKQCEAKVR